MEKNGYFYLSESDFHDASILFEAGSYRSVGRFCQQAIEKRFKHFLEKNGERPDISLMYIHKLGKLYRRLNALGVIKYSESDYHKLSTISDYYYDLNYPNENFEELTKQEAKKAMEMVSKMFKMLPEFKK